ncbi:hypothetical protein [Halomonas sp. SpR8]|uniref:hypothetical protein n=1 Tax=Halomonas sp. SpR8 TaxID=3050463 RepID=UPI0027E52A0F|nr:hypothetical protein [Halomonas sp. SpR8]MDQ7730551.1 hypothetical protein [Halomonas sp. SpR8]
MQNQGSEANRSEMPATVHLSLHFSGIKQSPGVNSMFNEFVKKAAVVGLSFGLLASPLAFAHMSIEANQDITANDEPIHAQSHRSTDQTDFSPSDLMYDEGDRPMVVKAESTSTNAQATYTPKDLIRENGS